MQHLILRCKHCGKTYTYCTYGNTDECSMEYCGECQSAINKALNDIPIKMIQKYKEINDEGNLIINMLDSIRNNCNYTPMTYWSNTDPYDNTDIYYHNNILYKVCYNDNNTDDKHIYILCEYDCVNNKFTNNVWKTDVSEDRYSHHKNIKHEFLNLKDIPEGKIDMPNGNIMWFDMIEKNVDETPKIKHKLYRYTIKENGSYIKYKFRGDIENYIYINKTKININSLEDAQIYSCTYEYYLDERNKSFLVDIKAS